MPDSKQPKTLEEQIYDKDGRLTYEGAKLAMANGHAVMFGTVIINDPDKLPSQADFAGADQTKQAAARQALLLQQQKITEELAKLGIEPTQPLFGHVEHPSLEAPVGGLGDGDTAGMTDAQAKKAAKDEAKATSSPIEGSPSSKGSGKAVAEP